MRVCVDWDDTLVDVRTKDWLPGAARSLRRLVTQGNTVIIHSCRANWPAGLAEIQAKLATERLTLEVVGKPDADLYVDDRALRFRAWPDVLNEVHAHTLKARHERAMLIRNRLTRSKRCST